MEKITTLDIEASGLSPHSYPLEIGIVLSNGDCWCSLIKPASSWTDWSCEAEAIHKITRRHVEEHGKTIRCVAETLNQLLKGQTVYSDCWVLDDRWLRKLFAEARLAPSFQLRDIMYLLKENDFLSWEKVKTKVAEELAVHRHRATNDARILQESFFRITESHKSQDYSSSGERVETRYSQQG